MKAPSSPHIAVENTVRSRLHHRSQGVALVLVLGFIVLCTVLVVAFFASVSTEAVSARAAASENSAAQLAGSAVQLVEGTISYATEPAADTTYAWACQPGMIRTYGSPGGGPGAKTPAAASASPQAYFKLYSSDNMVVTPTTTPSIANFSFANEVPANWDKLPSLYADLNAPLIKQVPNGTATPASTVIFPIVDPRAQDLGVDGFSTTATSATLDGLVPVTGAAGAGAAADPTKFAADSKARLPMPVRWMYVRRDGTMTVPSSGDATSATFDGASAQFAANPIVGRVAFWTDDEDAKINVNTASEGTYADMPIANVGPTPSTSSPPDYTTAIGDITLAVNQGAQHEYQRYPGHPATTCLSPVFGNALSSFTSRATLVKAITDVIPRITDYATTTGTSGRSSMGGTQDSAPVPYPTTGTPPPLQPDLDRLYASLDEFQFNPLRSTLNLGTGTTQGTEQNLVDACRFFLTAHSKAPDLNLFGLPRVAIWPAWNDANDSKRTNFDQEILRCSTVANTDAKAHRMMFTRADPTNMATTTDFNITRNQQVYGYLQKLMSYPIPGFGGNFVAKYGSTDANQILTEIFDYIRCTNLADQTKDGTANNSYTPSIPPGGTNTKVALGQVVPAQGTSGRGIGRIGTIAELALVLVKIDDRVNTAQAEDAQLQLDPAPAPTVPNRAASLSFSGDSSGTIDPSKQTLVEWALVPKFFSPMAGYAGLGNDFRVRFVVNNLKIGDYPSISKAAGSLADEWDAGRLPNGGRAAVLGGLMGVTFPIWGSGSQGTSSIPTGLAYVSGTNKFNGSVNGGTIQVSGDVDAYIYAPNTQAAKGSAPIQTLHFEFPTSAQSVPIPTLVFWTGTSATGTFRNTKSWTTSTSKTGSVTTGKVTFTYDTVNTNKSGGAYGRRWDGSLDHFLGEIGHSQPGFDTVRSLVPTGTLGGTSLDGDLRLIAASQEVPKEAWALAQKNVGGALTISSGAPATSTDYQVTNLRDSNYFPYASGAQGSLFPLASPLKFGNQRGPEIPPGIAYVTMTNPTDGGVPGDWDNGPGLSGDGPYVNKPNEGESGNASGAGGIPYVGPDDSVSTYLAASTAYFSPNLQVSSPVMFGSLPVGVDHPWRTLLFRPATLPGYQNTSYKHPGGKDSTIRDHLLLDLFWMPIVEPYGISEPFATSGKINLNTQIAPFTYITRTTGLRGVLKSVMLTALNPAQYVDSSKKGQLIGSYKNGYGTATGQSVNPLATDRYPIDLDQTISQITTTPLNATSPPADNTNPYPEFARSTHTSDLPNFFVSASQICDLPLIPLNTKAVNLSSFWTPNLMTGDNSLERPYSLIYPRVTTKSNIFTVHVLAQSLKKITTDSKQNVWNENKDQVTSEYHGAYTIEKYFDPNTDNLTDSSGNILDPNNDGSIDATAGLRSTKWRLVSLKRLGQ